MFVFFLIFTLPNQFAITLTTPGHPVAWKHPVIIWQIVFKMFCLKKLSNLHNKEIPKAMYANNVGETKQPSRNSTGKCWQIWRVHSIFLFLMIIKWFSIKRNFCDTWISSPSSRSNASSSALPQTFWKYATIKKKKKLISISWWRLSPAEEHEECIGEKVGRVQHPQVGLCWLWRLPINLVGNRNCFGIMGGEVVTREPVLSKRCKCCYVLQGFCSHSPETHESSSQ